MRPAKEQAKERAKEVELRGTRWIHRHSGTSNAIERREGKAHNAVATMVRIAAVAVVVPGVIVVEVALVEGAEVLGAVVAVVKELDGVIPERG